MLPRYCRLVAGRVIKAINIAMAHFAGIKISAASPLAMLRALADITATRLEIAMLCQIAENAIVWPFIAAALMMRRLRFFLSAPMRDDAARIA